SILTGPITSVLTHFDLSNKMLWVLWLSLVLPYWFAMGIGIALIRRWTRNPEDIATQGILESDLKTIRLGIEIASIVIAALCFYGGPIDGPTRIPMRRAIRPVIISNLRKIDGAKQLLASEKNLPPDYVPTENELVSCLERGG